MGETVLSIKPLLAVLVSLAAVVPIAASGRRPNLREGWTFLAGGLKFYLILSMLPVVLAGQSIEYTWLEVLPGLPIAFRVDALGMLFALVASFLWLVTSTYSIGYMRGLQEHSQTRYFAFFAVSLSATIGVAFAANLFTLYLFYEVLSLATYPLVTHHQDQEARASGRKYLAFILGTSIGLVLPAMLIVYSQAGTLDFAAGPLAGDLPRQTVLLLLFMFIFGFAKAGVMPFHAWLPAAMVAPTPVSALLHAVAVVKVGVFSIARVAFDVLGVQTLGRLDVGVYLAIAAAVTILVASLIALSQDGLKRRLAFSTIGQLSYILLGIGLLAPKAMVGGLVHIAMHAFGKITLFMCAGAIFVATGKKYISDMDGIGRRMPITMAAFFLGALSIIGLPPGGGFVSKWYLLLGALEADKIGFGVVLLASSLLNTAYFMPIVYRAFFKPPADGQGGSLREAPIQCVAPLALTALGSVALLFYPQPFLQLAEQVVARLLGG